MQPRAFMQVDVFGRSPCGGNPVAVVLDADRLDTAEMLAFTRWCNLSEATFVLPPSRPGADYRLRIFTSGGELPFAGHPTLGSARAWLAHGGTPKTPGELVQECGAGLVHVREQEGLLAFAAPPLLRTGGVEPALAARIRRGLGLGENEVRAMAHVDNGPGWIGVLLDSAARVLDLDIDRNALRGLAVGVIGSHPTGGPVDFEVRAFYTGSDLFEDPVTGSLNASLAQWLIGAGSAPVRYRARQGTALGRAGEVHIEQAGGEIWVGGETRVLIEGRLHL